MRSRFWSQGLRPQAPTVDAVAFRRLAHNRMTAIVERKKERLRREEEMRRRREAEALVGQGEVRCLYRNWRGEERWRRVEVLGVYHGSTQWHPRLQWLVLVRDLEKDAERDFALDAVREWSPPGVTEGVP